MASLGRLSIAPEGIETFGILEAGPALLKLSIAPEGIETCKYFVFVSWRMSFNRT